MKSSPLAVAPAEAANLLCISEAGVTELLNCYVLTAVEVDGLLNVRMVDVDRPNEIGVLLEEGIHWLDCPDCGAMTAPQEPDDYLAESMSDLFAWLGHEFRVDSTDLDGSFRAGE